MSPSIDSEYKVSWSASSAAVKPQMTVSRGSSRLCSCLKLRSDGLPGAMEQLRSIAIESFSRWLPTSC